MKLLIPAIIKKKKTLICEKTINKDLTHLSLSQIIELKDEPTLFTKTRIYK